MSISRINFKQLRQENLKETFAAFERAFVKMDISFYLIGALARDIWFAGKGIRALGTKDIDLAVMVAEKQKWEELKKFLINKENFTATSNEYTIRDPNGFDVDLFPFGELSIEGRKITDTEGVVHTDITGFKEIYEGATQEVSVENKYNFQVASLAAIAILKLIAWDDRPEMRSDHIADIAIIINHYFELEQALIYEKHTDLFELDLHDLKIVSARVLGREMRSVLQKNQLLYRRVVDILQVKQPAIKRKFLPVLIDDNSPQFLNNYHAEIIQQILAGIEEDNK